ncbi:putative ribonuclease H-like domain-containing protein [Tanacetum coccineum]
MALMAFSDSKVYNDKSCSKTCLKNYETLKKQCDDFIVKLNETKFKATTYKRDLATVEELPLRNNLSHLERIRKKGIDFKITKFDNASKDLDKLLASQITDKSKKGLGYHDVAPPHPLTLNAPIKLNLSYSGLDEFKEPEFNGYGPRDTVLKPTINNENESDNPKENSDDSLVKEQVSEDETSSIESPLKVDKETVFHTAKKVEFVKPKNNEKPVKKTVRYFHQKVNTVRPRVVIRPRVVNTARPYTTPVNTVRANGVNAVKALACWGKPQMNDKGFVDNGCSRHMTGNIAYLLNFKEFDGGYVTFRGGAYGGRISGKGTLKTNNLDFKFCVEAVSTACYVQNRVLIVKPHNKTPYELFRGFKLALSFMRPFGYHVTILNTLDNLGKLDGKSDEGLFVGYSLSIKAFRVYNTRTKKVEENFHVGFLENKPMLEGNGPKWLFDIDSLTQSINYVPVAAGTISNESAGIQGDLNAGTSTQKEQVSQDCILMPIWKDASYFDSPSKDVGNDEPKSVADDPKQVKDGLSNESDSSPKEDNTADQPVNTASPKLNTGGPEVNTVVSPVNTASPKDMLGANHSLKATHIEFFSDEDEPEVKLGNILNSYAVPTSPHTRIHKDHPLENVIGDVQSSIQTRRSTSQQGFLSAVYKEKTHEDLHILDLPKGKRPNGVKWIFKNKTDERGIVIRNKVRLVTQGYTQEEGIDYDDVFAPVARIEAIILFLAYASFMGFMVYQMDVKSAFLYGTIEEEVYVCQPLGFEDPDYPDKVYKVVKSLYGLHQAPRAWYETLAKYLLDNGFQRGKIDQTLFIKRQKGDILLVQVYVDDIIFGSTKKEMCTEFEKLIKDKFQMSSMGELTFFLGLQVKQKADGIFISQDKYVGEILRKFNYTYVKSASTTIDLEKPLVKDGDADDVDVHLYRSMIGSLMYLTTSRPDIMFAVCAYARFQVTPKTSHLTAVKRIFRYLKGKPTLGLWKSTIGGCQFLGNRLISWQCKKQTVVATSITEAKYVAAASCYEQVGDEAVHKELGDRMERAATTASRKGAEQDSDAQTRFEAASKSPMIHLSQEVTHLEVGRTV